MKRALFALAVLPVLFLSFFSFSSVAQASSVATISAPSHRHLDGTFSDDLLATELAPDGKFGKLVYGNFVYTKFWRIDPAFIEDIQSMSVGYKLSSGVDGVGKDSAIAWLKKLKQNLVGARVEAIAYGNPSEYWVRKFFPHDGGYYLSASAQRLSALLEKNVEVSKGYDSTQYFSLTSAQERLLRISAARIDSSSAYLESSSLEKYKLDEVKMLNPTISASWRQTLAYDLAANINTLRNSVRVSGGKFTITSANQQVPITVINDFPQPIAVDLSIHSANEKVYVDDISNVLVPGKSKVQVLVPLKVYASGDSGFIVTVKGHVDSVYGQTVTYPLKIAVISPIATWITGAAALVLFGAAILKSLRRIRRKKSARGETLEH